MSESITLDLLKKLRLTGMESTLAARLNQARESSLSYEELLMMLFHDELESRQQKSLFNRV